MNEVDEQIKNMYLSGDYTYHEIGRAVGKTANAIGKIIRKSNYYQKDKLLISKETGNVSNEIRADGTIIRNRILDLTEDELASPAKLMVKHGFDPLQWELVSAVNNLWDTIMSEQGQVTQYQSKITVKPLKFDYNVLLDTFNNHVSPIHIPQVRKNTQNSRALVVCLNDLHFGEATLDMYQPHLDATLDVIERGYEKVIVYLAGDLVNTDNLKGNTAHGTHVGQIDFPKAISDLHQYVCTIIESSIKSGAETEVVFVRGNHSETVEYMFTLLLKQKYPQIPIDDSLDYVKARLLWGNFLGLAHGYRGKKNIALNLSKLFSKEWGQAEHHEILLGHEHRESRDEGALLRVLPTAAPSNDWAMEQQFLLVNKAFQLLEYDESTIRGVYYV